MAVKKINKNYRLSFGVILDFCLSVCVRLGRLAIMTSYYLVHYDTPLRIVLSKRSCLLLLFRVPFIYLFIYLLIAV